MSPKIRAVFFKELRDSLRDRRTVFATVVIPLVLYPVMLLLTAEVTQMAQAKLDREVHLIAIPVGMRDFFEVKLKNLPPDEKSGGDEFKQAAPSERRIRPGAELKTANPALNFAEMAPEAAEKALATGNVRAVVVIAPDFEAGIAALKTIRLEVKYDQAEQRSLDASQRVRALFERYRKSVVNERLARSGLARATLEPFSITTTNVAQPAKVGGSVMGSFLPLLFIMMIITGAIYPAIDMTAGEKERSTLETLISTPVRPIEIISGKFLAVATMALGNATLNVGSFALTFSMMPLAKMGGFEFPWAALPLTLLLLLPLALFFSGLLLAVSSFAANQKEAQIYCLPVYLIPVLGMMVVMMPGIELEGPLLLTPVINTALLIKQLFLSHGTAQQVAFVFFSTCLYAAGAVALAARIFAREEVLFSAQGNLRLFLSRRYFKPAATPRPGDALLVLALLFPLSFYFELWLGKILGGDSGAPEPGQIAWVLILKQYLTLLAPPILVAWYLKADLKQTFAWRMPAFRAALGGLLLGSASWLIATELTAWQSHFWEYLPLEMQGLENALKSALTTWHGTALVVFLIGVTPAICEEHLFRGLLQQGIQRIGKWPTLLAVGFIFGAYHFPLYRQPVVMLMGVALAYTAWETASLWPGVIFHMVHNSCSAVIPTLFGNAEATPAPGQPLPNVPLQYLLPAVVVFITGLLLVRGARRTNAAGARDVATPSETAAPLPLPAAQPAASEHA